MNRRALHSLPRRKHGKASRGFHSTARCNQGLSAEISDFGTKCYAFHDVFQQVHDFTALPWLLSIPLTTVLFRSLWTPVRYYFATYHRDQKLARPELEIEGNVLQKQLQLRTEAGVGSFGENAEWVQEEWQKRRGEIVRNHPRAKPSIFVSTTTNYDVSNLGVTGLLLLNTSTLLSLSATDPSFSELAGMGPANVLLSVWFFMLARSNISYYHRHFMVPVGGSGGPTLRDFNPLKWSPSELNLLIPGTAAFLLALSPGAAVVLALSNSTYTLIERRFLEWSLGLEVGSSSRVRTAVQLTTRPGHPYRPSRWP